DTTRRLGIGPYPVRGQDRLGADFQHDVIAARVRTSRISWAELGEGLAGQEQGESRERQDLKAAPEDLSGHAQSPWPWGDSTQPSRRLLVALRERTRPRPRGAGEPSAS